MEVLPLSIGIFCSLVGIVSGKIAQKFFEEGNRPWACAFMSLAILSALNAGFMTIMCIFAAMTFDAKIEPVMFFLGLIIGCIAARKITVVREAPSRTSASPAE